MRAGILAIALFSAGCGTQSVDRASPDAGEGIDAGETFDASGPVGMRDSGTVAVDAALPDAYGPPPGDGGGCDGELELGRCLLATGGPCTGVPDDPARFVGMSDADPLPVVIGPQGSSMFVLSARTRGIMPGDPTMPASRANPVVEIEVFDAAGASLAIYRGRSSFAPDGADPTLLVQPQLFVIVDGTLDRLVGVLTARAMLTDAAGVTRCGVLSFTPTR